MTVLLRPHLRPFDVSIEDETPVRMPILVTLTHLGVLAAIVRQCPGRMQWLQQRGTQQAHLADAGLLQQQVDQPPGRPTSAGQLGPQGRDGRYRVNLLE
jgi:hypothetical protein